MSDITNFGGGLQTTTSPFLQKDNQCSLAINVHFDNVGAVTKRLGYAALGTAAGSQINGLHSYNDISTGYTRLFRARNGSIDYWNGSTWGNVTSYTPTDARIEFRVFLNQMFVFGANSSTCITPININGLTASTTNNLTNAPKGRFVEVYKDQVYVADCVVGSTRYGSRLYRSSIPDLAGTGITWDPTDYETFLANNGETITGIHANKGLNVLLVFKNNSMHTWDTYRIDDVGTVGTNCHRSIQTIDSTTYFYSPRKGIYAYNGSSAPIKISRPIDKWIKGIQSSDNVFAVTQDGMFYKLYVGQMIVDGVTYNNCEIRYSKPDNTWTIYKYYDNFSIYAQHEISGLIRPYAGDTAGYVHQLAVDGDEVYSDNTHPIATEFMTKSYDLGKIAEKKFASKAIIYATKHQNITGRVRFRGKDWESYFNVDDAQAVVNINPSDGRFCQFHFSESSSFEPWQITGLSFDPAITGDYV